MDEKYRLIFSGELLDGQHRAVVKRRLIELLKLKDGQVEKLFSGQPVVLKRDVDRETAARYQALFKKAGGQLRVKSETPAEGAPVAENVAEKPAPASMEGRPAAVVGIEAPDFKVQSTWFPPAAAASAEIEAPDYAVAAVGSDLTDKKSAPIATVAEVDFDLAEVGADLLTERKDAPVVDLGPLAFELADVGADIGTPNGSEQAVAPDVSHIVLMEPEQISPGS